MQVYGHMEEILLNIMFHAPMGRFQLELIYYFTYFSPLSHPMVVFLSCRPFAVNTAFSTGLVGVKVSSTSTPTRPVENIVLTTKGLQDRNIHIFDGRTVENKGKLILTEIFPSVQKHDI